MKILKGDILKNALRFAPDIDGQVLTDRITLTVLDVLQIAGEGRTGPSESMAEEARRIKRPARKSSSDPLGYWDLVQGPYWLTFNEAVIIPSGGSLVLQPHDMLLKNGLWHPTLLVRDWDEISGVLLVVSARGVRMMEGTPISTGFIVE